MNKFCAIINNGYSANYKIIKLPFKKKYVYILNKLLNYNCIGNFKIFNNIIEVNLKYYNNKPIFKLNVESTSLYNKNYKIYFIEKIFKNDNFNLNIYSTTSGFLTKDEVLFKKKGGKCIISLKFLDNKTVLK